MMIRALLYSLIVALLGAYAFFYFRSSEDSTFSAFPPTSNEARIVAASKAEVFVKGEMTISVKSVETFDDGVEVYASVKKQDKQVGFGKDGSVETERFRFHNLGTYVPDPNGELCQTTPADVKFNIPEVTQCFRDDPAEALRIALADTVRIVARDTTPKAGKIGNTTDTFYPDPNVESTSVDGYAGETTRASWATIHGVTTADTTNDTTTPVIVIIYKGTATEWDLLYRGIVLFDTSSLTGETVDSATLSLYVTTDSETGITPDQGVNIVSSSPASNTSITGADYNEANFGTTVFSTDKTVGSIGTGAYADWVFNASGIAAVSTTGVSKFGVRLSGDTSNSEPTAAADDLSNFRFSSAEVAGTTQDPKLVVVHSAGGGAAGFEWGQVI